MNFKKKKTEFVAAGEACKAIYNLTYVRLKRETL